MTTTRIITLALSLTLAAAACSKGDATEGGADNLGTTTPTEANDAEAADADADTEVAKEPLDCTKINGGPEMVMVKTPRGDSYCIDTTKVTQKQYAEFLASTKQKPGTEHHACDWNESYAPKFSDDTQPGGCYVGPGIEPGTAWLETDYYSPEETPDRPVTCVDWCDAVAFCQWAGKRLCGKVGGGSLSADVEDAEYDDSNRSQWYNACSNGGVTKYPYGDEYDPDACETDPERKWPWVADVKSAPECHGLGDGFSEVFELAGRGWEFENAYEVWKGDGAFYVGLRGVGSLSDKRPCGDFGTTPPQAVGGTFRCCKD